MQCPKCQFEQNDSNQECRKCGVIFTKHQKRQRQNNDYIKHLPHNQDTGDCEESQLSRLLFPAPTEINYVSLGGGF